jgi:flavin-dependent dehydrogenase
MGGDAGCEVELEGGQKLKGKFAVLADGVHSKMALKLHKAKVENMHAIGWRCMPGRPALMMQASRYECTLCGGTVDM